MSGKQMEGDNQRRRALGRRSRERERRPSQAGVTLGASKQFEHLDDKRRAGPPAAGGHKPVPGQDGVAMPPPPAAGPLGPPALSAPVPARNAPGSGPLPPAPAGTTRTGYQELIAAIAERAGVDFPEARAAAEATVTLLAARLDSAGRQRLREAVPVQLRETMPMSGDPFPRTLPAFLGELAWLRGQTEEQARYQAEATLTALAERHPHLVGSLDLPAELRQLFGPASE